MMIKIKNLYKLFGSKLVLEDLTCAFEAGKVYGIVGANGAGKTTLFNCIAGLEDYRGSIQTNIDPLKNKLGFLPTQPYFPSKITGWEYLKLLTLARGITVEDFGSKNIFSLPLDQYATTYSTGMQKKLALMAILLQKNEVFILDEPFNGVDIQSNILIMKVLNELKSAGKTVLISSHIFSTLSETCDEILLLKNHRIQEKVLPEDYKKLDTAMQSEVNLADVKVFFKD
jgi:ABC-2 type transport system ATP-binding protein